MAVNSPISPLRSSTKRSLFRDNTPFRHFTRVDENDRFEECTPLSSNSESSPEKETPPKERRFHKRIPFSLLITPNKQKTVIPETPTKNDDSDSISSSPSLQLYPNLGTPTTPKPQFDGIPTDKFYPKYMRIPDFSLCFPPISEEDKKKAERKRPPKRKRIDLSQPGVWHNIRKPKVRKTLKKKSLKRKFAEMMSPLMKSTTMINTPPVTPEDELESPTKVSIEEEVPLEEEDTPDLSKKFFKHSHTRAVVTLNKNVKFNLTASGGKLTVKRNLGFTPQTKKKRRTMTKAPLEPIRLFEEQNEEANIVAEGQIETLIGILDETNQDGTVHIEEHLVNVMTEEELLETLENNENSKPPVILSVAEQIDKDFSEFLETDASNETIDDISPPKIQDEMANLESNSNEKLLLTPSKHSLSNMDDLVSPGQMVRDLTDSTSSLALASPDGENSNKFYPIFDKNHFDRTESTPTSSAKKKIAFHPSIENQSMIDAGQKKFGAISCSVCGLLYEHGNDQDEKIHNDYHEHRNVLRFKGWNKERVVVEIDLFKRIIVVYPNDPKIWLTKCLEIIDQLDRELGFPLSQNRSLNGKKVYLYINKDSVAGCIVAEPITQGFKLIPSSDGSLDTFSEEPTPAKCGISRIWTNSQFRRQGIAVQLLDAVRFNFMFGGILSKSDLAFSAPTNNGKELGKKYFGKNDFLIYV